MSKREHKQRMSNALGMSEGAARNKLVKRMLFAYLQMCGHNVCHRCQRPILHPDDLSIVHLTKWLDAPDPAAAFWALENVGFSHNQCDRRTEMLSLELTDKHGNPFPTFWHDGERHVCAKKGRQFKVMARNNSPKRLKVIITVDGRDVISGEPGGFADRGYVIDPYAVLQVDGFRQTMDSVAAFEFSDAGSSYSAQQGTPGSVGVVAAAVFEEEAVIPPVVVRPVVVEPRVVPIPYPRPCPPYWWPLPDRVYIGDFPTAQTLVYGSDGCGGPHVCSVVPQMMGASGQEGQVKSSGGVLRGRGTQEVGTGYGDTMVSRCHDVSFRQKSSTPDEVVKLYYDSEEGLRSRGIEVSKAVVVSAPPDPFPGRPRVDPGFAKPPEGKGLSR